MIALLTGNEIIELRKRLGYSPTQLAAAIGVSESAVNRWEKGNRVPKVSTLIRINVLAKKAGLLPEPATA